MSGIRWTAAVAALLAWAAAGCTTAAWAQSALERLEQRLRQELAQGLRPAQPGQIVAEPVADKGPEVQPGYLGVTADDRNDRGRGVRILAMHPGGPGEKAGLRTQDLIVDIAGVRVRQMSDMADVLAAFPPGQTVTVEVLRRGVYEKVKVTLGLRAEGPGGPEIVPAPPGQAPGEGNVLAVPAPPEPAVPAAKQEPIKPLEGPQLAGPGLVVEDAPRGAADPAAEIDRLRRRIEQLERRIETLERALAEKDKSGKDTNPKR